jgi:hypothetical protein
MIRRRTPKGTGSPPLLVGRAPARSGVVREKGRDSPLLVVGTRSRAIRGGPRKGGDPPLLVVGTRSRAIRGGPRKGGDPPLLVVGTRSRTRSGAIRRCTSFPRATPDRAGTRPLRAMTLRRFRRPAPIEERCELCSAGLASIHRHLLEMSNARIVCACDPCALRFQDAVGGRFKLIPRQVRFLSQFHLTDPEWESLALPINLARKQVMPDLSFR